MWSVVCFAVDRPAQGKGIPAVLLEAAVEHASRRGAESVEGYPHMTKKDDYMGSLDLFLEHGFGPVRETSKRAIVRRAC